MISLGGRTRPPKGRQPVGVESILDLTVSSGLSSATDMLWRPDASFLRAGALWVSVRAPPFWQVVFAAVQLLSCVWLHHARLLCPSLSPGVRSHSCPLSQWCSLTISSSAAPPPLAFSLSQHQGLFQWVSSSHQVGKVVGLQLQHQSFQWIFRVDFL